MIIFDDIEDLKAIIEGWPWLFIRQLIVFEWLINPMDRTRIKQILSPFWMKIGPCPPGCGKQDLVSAAGQTFGGGERSEIKGDFYCL